MSWTRARIALVACAGASALALLYVGLFQAGWIEGLACPGFGSGCESVALARFSRPLGFSGGLLAAALCGLIAALAQMRSREAAAALVGCAFVNLLAHLVSVFQMAGFGASCLWCLLSAALSLPVAALSVTLARSEGGGAAPVLPDDRAQQ